MEFQKFNRSLSEAFTIFAENIISIFCTVFITSALLICMLCVEGIILFILFPESMNAFLEDGGGFATFFVTTTNANIACIAICVMLTLIIRSSIFSIYSFYITFKEDGVGIELFFSMLRRNFRKVFRAQCIAFIRITVGLICLIIPGIVLYFRYAGISYFILSENTTFNDAREQSTQAMVGFKLLLSGYILMLTQGSKLINYLYDFFVQPNITDSLFVTLPVILVLYTIPDALIMIFPTILVNKICNETHGKYFRLSSANVA